MTIAEILRVKVQPECHRLEYSSRHQRQREGAHDGLRCGRRASQRRKGMDVEDRNEACEAEPIRTTYMMPRMPGQSRAGSVLATFPGSFCSRHRCCWRSPASIHHSFFPVFCSKPATTTDNNVPRLRRHAISPMAVVELASQEFPCYQQGHWVSYCLPPAPGVAPGPMCQESCRPA